MKSKLLSLIAFLLLFTLSSFCRIGNENGFSLTVQVDHLRNSDGTLQFTLYNREGSIPDEKFNKYFKICTTKISNGSATALFENLPEGKYAVNILHDENNNGKIDKGFILPKEGIGFSNYQSIGLAHIPKFKKASFDLKSDLKIQVKIIYF